MTMIQPYVTMRHFGTAERQMNRILSVTGMSQIPYARRRSSQEKLLIHTVWYLFIFMSSQNSRVFPVSSLMIDPAK